MHYRLSAARTVVVKGGLFRPHSLQQQLAGPSVTGPGMKAKAKSSVLHQCAGPNCAVCS